MLNAAVQRLRARPGAVAAAALARKSAVFSTQPVRRSPPLLLSAKPAPPRAKRAAISPWNNWLQKREGSGSSGYFFSTTTTKDQEPAIDREYGTVKWFDPSKGYGFIIRPNGTEVFCHYSNIRGKGYRCLEEGQRVSYIATDGRDNRGPRCEDVTLYTD